ncbi:replication-relaxation family protein [Streptomyces sp. NPDC056661]|uniref:replication-relaxation family protein n=1 Tax=Streptomyces sp. NPDC056661 TaxID=3345898 RepID=UPI0036BA66ED
MESVGRTSSPGANGPGAAGLVEPDDSRAPSGRVRAGAAVEGDGRYRAGRGEGRRRARPGGDGHDRRVPPVPATADKARRSPHHPPRPAPDRVLPVRPRGLGHWRGWETEVALPVTGTFTTPARGSLRADAVLTAPEDQVPVLFVEVDNHTEPAAVVAAKIDRYQRFFRRQVKNDRGRDVPLWSMLWDDSGRGGFTHEAGTATVERRLRRAAPGLDAGDLSNQGVGMNDNDHADETPQERIAKVALYLESVKGRMPAEEFETLHQAVHEMVHLIADGREGFLETGDRENFTDNIQREFLTVMAIVMTGRMDHQVVDMPGRDGSPGYAVVTQELANDPEELAKVREKLHDWATEREAIDTQLDSIAHASNIDTDH